MNGVLGVEHDGDDLLLPEAEVDFEIVPVTGEELRVEHFGLVRVLMTVVVLDEGEHAIDGCAGEEGGADPVMNEAVGNGEIALAGLGRGYDIAVADLREAGGRLGGPEKVGLARLAVDSCLGGTGVVVEGGEGLGF
jgi:hypothetical protein